MSTIFEHALPKNISVSQLAMLQQMVEEISGELALEPLLTRIVERACKLIGADDGTIALYDPVYDLMRTAVIYQMPEHELNAEMRRGEGLAGLVLASGNPIRCRYGDLPQPTSGEPNDNFVIGLPIRAHDRIIGAFGIGVWPPRQLDESHQQLLGQFARHAAVAAGQAWLHPAAQAVMLELLRRPPSPIEQLTARERSVLELLAEGLSNKMIARKLGLSTGTVKGYVSQIFAKLDVADRTQAALLAHHEGINASRSRTN